MDRRATRTVPVQPACAECIRLDNQRQAAELEGDLSGAVDCRVLLRRHRTAEHGGEQ